MKRLAIYLSLSILAVVLPRRVSGNDVTYVYTEATSLTLSGRLFPDVPVPYHRIDTARFKGFSPMENQLVRESSGLSVAFLTDSPSLSVRTEYAHRGATQSSCRIATEGYDLYIKRNGTWVFADAAVAQGPGNPATVVLAAGMDANMKECLLYLPLYSELQSLQIGVEAGRTLEPAPEPFRHRIALFGSSFSHGAGASRSGMTYPAQLARATGLNLLSIACSGHATLQPYFADVLAAARVDAILLDVFSNPSAETIHIRLFPFLMRLRRAHPDIPIIFQRTIRREGRNFRIPVEQKEAAKMRMADSLMQVLMKHDKHIFYIRPEIPGGENACTVDGIHPDSYGYTQWKKSIEAPLREILGKYGIR